MKTISTYFHSLWCIERQFHVPFFLINYYFQCLDIYVKIYTK